MMLSFAAIAQCTSTLTGPNMEFAPPYGSYLPDAVISQPYETTIELYLPSQYFYGGDTLDVLYFLFVGFMGAPANTTFSTTPANNELPPGNACIHIYNQRISDTVYDYRLYSNFYVVGVDSSGDTISSNTRLALGSHYLSTVYGTPWAEIYVNGDTALCAGDVLSFWPLYDYDSASYSFSSAGANLIGSSASGISTFEFPSAGLYDVILTASHLGTAYDTVQVSVTGYPAVNILPNGFTASCGGSAVLAYSSGATLEVDNPQPGYNYQWYHNGSAVPGATSATYTPTQTTGAVTVWSSENGCGQLAYGFTLTDTLLFNVELCLVTVDSATNKNQLIWEKLDTISCIDSVRIWKETNVTDVYELLTTLDYNDMSTFIDTASNPEQKADKYKLSLNGSGIESAMSIPHKTIHLSVNAGQGNVINLIWNDYEGAPVSTYNIYRGTNPSNLALYASVSGSNTSFTDLNPNGTANIYQIEVVLPYTCNPSKTGQAYTRSNKFDASDLVSSINDDELLANISIAPNPTSGLVTFKADGIEVEGLKMFSIQGAEVFRAAGFEQGVQTTLDVSELGTGLYIVQIQLADGKILNTKLLVD